MPLSPANLTTYHLNYTDGRFASAVQEPETRAVSLLPVMLAGFNSRTRRGEKEHTTPVFVVPCLSGEHTIAPDSILFEPYELPAVLRDMLWPREVPAEVAAPDAPPTASPFPGAGNIDDEPDHAPSSDYSEPAV